MAGNRTGVPSATKLPARAVDTIGMQPTLFEHALFFQALIALAARRDVVLRRELRELQELLLRSTRLRARA
jgi:hypothetical protein